MNNVTPLTVEAMAAWALAQQQLALCQMNVTTGEAFSEHCEEFMRFTNALCLIRRFEHQARG
jgi:hypothetical protein